MRTRIVVPSRLALVTVANLLGATFALIWLLPSPWGAAVPIVLLVQVAWLRHGAARTAGVVTLAAVAGAVAAPLLGISDARRTAVAMLLLVLPLAALWPARSGASGRR